MAFFASRTRSVPRTPRSSLPIIAVGQRVFVSCPSRELVSLGDESGKRVSAVRLTDGLEVEVIAWRPRGANETRYRVRVPSTGADGWLPAVNLRKSLVPLPTAASRTLPRPASPAVTPARPAPVADDRRRFGQHFDPEHSPASGSSASAKPAPTVAGGRRRFGQAV